MEPNKNKINIDPDYEINNTALRKIEEKEREESKLTSEKLSKIITEEFDKELSIRQKQLEEIEDKICKAQKLLHLVRYVLVTSYYNKKSLEINTTGEESVTTPFLGAQNRIHPAVKKLLDVNSSLEVFNCRGKRKAHSKSSDNETSTSQPFALKKIKLEKKESLEDTSKCQLVENNQNSFNRKKTRHRIVIGNISKWMPSLENDNTTHKWMVYVRSLEETIDVSCIIEKVVFYLHPSYKPHDVVEVNNSPFHLSRRGWGEFPLRVEIFFKCPLNKPVSIVHNLKLDKTYTGRQTLGNETVVDLYLHSDNVPLKQEAKMEMFENIKIDIKDISDDDMFRKFDDIIIKEPLKIELDEEPVHIKMVTGSLIDIKPEPLDQALTKMSNFEHNYCHDGEFGKEKTITPESNPRHNFSLLEHSYSLPHQEYNGMPSDQCFDKNNVDIANQQPYNNLIYGLDDSYVESGTRNNSAKDEEKIYPSKDKCVRTFTTATGQPIKFLPQSFNSVLLNNGNVIQIRLLKQPQSILNKFDAVTVTQPDLTTDDKPIDYEKYKLTLPKSHFKNLGEALPYLFKRLPLWNSLADDMDFKCTYPFIACSKIEFMSWNIGKRISSEWSRAKAIKEILSTDTFPYLGMWNTKTFFMYGRSHGYSPAASYGPIFKKKSMELELLTSCFSDSLPQKDFFLKNSDIDIDVTADPESDNNSRSTLEKSHTIDISDNTLMGHCSFVKEAALDCGVVLKSEEILEGVVMNAAERMIFEALKCFAEHLIRRSRHHLVCQENFSEETSEISVEEIKIALSERSELRSIMNFQKRKREKEFFL